jgi:CBS domain containing-hemolysin-like protein
MYIVKQTIRYNDVTYKLGQEANFNEEDLKQIGKYVEEKKGEPKKNVNNVIVENKKTEETLKVDKVEKIENKSAKLKSTKK